MFKNFYQALSPRGQIINSFFVLISRTKENKPQTDFAIQEKRLVVF